MSIEMMDMSTKNLVVVRAGDKSLHQAWLGEDAEFDLIVSYYGDDLEKFRSEKENRVDYKGGKWDGIHDVFLRNPDLLNSYELVWLPDDDIECDVELINTMFRRMKEKNYNLAQPSLSDDSYYTHFIYLNCPSFKERFSTAVEIMVPVMKVELLKKVLPLMKDTMSGFGLDSLWARMMGKNKYKTVIFDDLTVRHTRPIGQNLAKAISDTGSTNRKEMKNLLEKFGEIEVFPLVYAATCKNGKMEERRWVLCSTMFIDGIKRYGRMVQKKKIMKNLKKIFTRHMGVDFEFGDVEMKESTK